MHVHRSLVAMLLALVSGVAIAQDCELVPLSAIDDALPSQAPWQEQDAGPGECTFAVASNPSSERAAAIRLEIDLRVMASPADADEHQRARLAEMQHCANAEDDPQLAPPAQVCRLAANPDGRQLLWVTTHQGRVIARTTLSAPAAAIRSADVEGLSRLAKLSLASADDEARLQALWHCPWLHGDAVEKLLGTTGFGQQAGAYETCMARSSVGSLAVVTTEADLAPELAPSASGDCTREALPELGEFGSVTFDCENVLGPLASVHAIVGDKFVEYNFQPGRDPTAAERALLIQIAKDSQAAASD